MRTALAAVALLLMPLAARAADGAAAKPEAPKPEAPKPAPAKPPADVNRTLYGIGLAVANNLEVFSLTPAELDKVIAGIRDGVADKGKFPFDASVETSINELARSRAPESAKRVAEREKTKGAAYLAKVSKEKGAKRSPSGAVVITEKEGTGATPTGADKVKVNYTGTLVSGRVFDASARHGGPAEFPVGGVIKCWTEALQMMKVGGKAKVVCPSDIAYGPGGNQGIPGNAVLTFDVELLDIVK